MGHCLFMRKGETHTAPSAYIGDPVFANNDWATIIESCQKNKVPDTWLVGDQKSMTINGTDYTIDVIGKNHDTYSDGSGTAPLTFQLHEIYLNAYSMNNSRTNVGGWESCYKRTTVIPNNIIPLMPEEVQTGLKTVNKLTSKGNQSTEICITADKVFYLSEVEVFGKNTNSAQGEGRQYEYYTAGNPSAKKMPTGDDYPWTLRSPSINDTINFCSIDTSGKATTRYANYSTSSAFAFCF